MRGDDLIMPRLARKDLGTSYFHIIVQGIEREYIFEKEEYIEKYIKLLKIYLKKYKVYLAAYCIMNNHAHMLIYTENINELSQYMKGINTSYGHYYNKIKNRVGFVFRNRYESQPIYNEKYLYSCIAYIHNNPVKANIVKEAREYKYSSYDDYINNRGVATDNIIKLIFGTTKGYKEQFMMLDELDCEFYDYKEKSEKPQTIIEEYLKENRLSKEEIIRDKELLTKTVKYLINEKKINKSEIGRLLGINRLRVMRLFK